MTKISFDISADAGKTAAVLKYLDGIGAKNVRVVQTGGESGVLTGFRTNPSEVLNFPENQKRQATTFVDETHRARKRHVIDYKKLSARPMPGESEKDFVETLSTGYMGKPKANVKLTCKETFPNTPFANAFGYETTPEEMDAAMTAVIKDKWPNLSKTEQPA